MHQKKAVIIGAGIAGLSAACYLAQHGYEVTILEKNDQPGGRARQFKAHGFTFDMGPSWYWMPDIFESFYNDFGFTTADFYALSRLDPSYSIVSKDGSLDIPAGTDNIQALFERLEPGSGSRLKAFLEEAAYKYQKGMKELAYKPSLSITEYFDAGIFASLFKMNLAGNMQAHINKVVKHPLLRQLLGFPVLFLGALPSKIPALYSLMNYADIQGGTWYPQGGMYKVIEAFTKIALGKGVQLMLNEEVKAIQTREGKVVSVQTANRTYEAGIVVGAADYHHVEQHLLEPASRMYSENYWQRRKMAPSCLLFFLGINKRIPQLAHHQLFFDAGFDEHAHGIYSQAAWPADPLFYVCTPSRTDNSVAPPGCENLFLLVPLAPGLQDDSQARRKYYLDLLLSRIEKYTGETIKDHIVFERSYCVSDFISDYHAFKGNAYGLANTLSQTALLKPRMKSSKVSGLYFAGQLTVPGPGLPPCIISGKIAAMQIIKDHKNQDA